MPTYRYRCEECCEEFSERRRMAERNDEAECPACGSRRTKRALNRFQVGTSSPGSSGGG